MLFHWWFLLIGWLMPDGSNQKTDYTRSAPTTYESSCDDISAKPNQNNSTQQTEKHTDNHHPLARSTLRGFILLCLELKTVVVSGLFHAKLHKSLGGTWRILFELVQITGWRNETVGCFEMGNRKGAIVRSILNIRLSAPKAKIAPMLSAHLRFSFPIPWTLS